MGYGGGLDLHGFAAAQANVRSGPSAPPASSAAEAAYGPSFGAPSDSSHPLFPNDPFGLAFWAGMAAVGFLVFIRYSLPAR